MDFALYIGGNREEISDRWAFVEWFFISHFSHELM